MSNGATDEQVNHLQTDVLVIGGGMAGLSAAATAAAHGARVLVLERSSDVGGSALLSGGYLWTASSVAAMSSANPDGDASLRRLVVENLSRDLDWVGSLNVDMGPEISLYDYGRGRQIDIRSFIRRCSAIVSSSGDIVTNVGVHSLIGDPTGAVIGAVVRDEGESAPIEIQARQTILATGGFQGSPELRARYIHPNARSMLLRANPNSTGAGLILGQSVGATLSPYMNGFYGHLVCSPIEQWTPWSYGRLSQYQSHLGILVNRHGDRFTDESVGDHYNAQAVVCQPEARAILLVDEKVRRTHMTVPHLEGTAWLDRFAAAVDAGGRYVRVSSLQELAHVVKRWSIDGDALLRTVLRYNSGALLASDPPRTRFHERLCEPPYHALEVQSAITFTHGGLAVDGHARTLTDERFPIPGLLAAGADVGGVYHRAYAGGLAVALVLGRQAAVTAVSAV
jgi:succinate dehydrogenase/fumarate reductase flavoprotein subunit